MLLGWASGWLRSEDKHWSLILLTWLPLNHLRGLWVLRRGNSSDSFMIPFLSSPKGLRRIFSRPQLQRGCLRSVRKTNPSPGVRLNKMVKSIRLHFSQGPLRKLRSFRAPGPLSAPCGVDLTWDSLTAGAENQRPQERCPICDVQVNVYDSALCFYLNFHYLAFMYW